MMQETFSPMRRADRALSEEDTRSLLSLARWGTLSLAPDEHGYPHAIPINCAYVDGALLFHCGQQGKKLDILKRDERACFSAMLSHVMVPDQFTAHFESVICYGRVRRVAEDEIPKALTAFTAAVFGVPEQSIAGEVARCSHAVVMLRMEIEHMTGKRSGPVPGHRPEVPFI